MAPLYKFVLTGGPCGGKTTAIAHVNSYFSERGFQVGMVPEVFSMLINSGTTSQTFEDDSSPAVIRACHNFILDTQIHLEDKLSKILQASGQPSILLCDRGPMDAAAYAPPDMWNELLESRGQTNTQLRDERYDAIFHLVTAADGAEEFYTLEGNEVRYETPEQARDVDKRTQGVWTGHAQLYVLHNQSKDGFNGKLQNLVNIMSRIVGLPEENAVTLQRSIKYLLKGGVDFSKFPANITYHRFKVEKIYLTNNSSNIDHGGDVHFSFLRKRTTMGDKGCGEDDVEDLRHSVYQMTAVSSNQVEHKRIISFREYAAACNNARDTSREVVHQERICFIYNQQSYTIHAYKSPNPGLCILHAHSIIEDADLPPFLDIDRRIQEAEDRQKYSAHRLSLSTPA